MNAEVLNARALTMRVGAVLAAFVLAFSLLLLAPPTQAEPDTPSSLLDATHYLP